jgi:hypothetical protein
MSVAVWWLLRVTALIGTILYLFLHMEWREDRLSPFALPSAPDADHRYVDERPFHG